MAFSFLGINGPRLTTILSWVFRSVLRDVCLTSGTFSIVAIHGLGGDWKETWTADNGRLWLRDFLPLQLPNARIMSYGYDSGTFFTQSTENITDIAATLLAMLRTKRRHAAEKARPIMFISHSLGGIVVKKAGIHNYRSQRNRVLTSIIY